MAMCLEQFRASIEANLTHYFTMTHLCFEMLKKNKGSIVNIGSKVSFTGQGGTSGYTASKGGVTSLTREWAVDLAAFGVRVNPVKPGELKSPMIYTSINSFDCPIEKLQQITANDFCETIIFVLSLIHI